MEKQEYIYIELDIVPYLAELVSKRENLYKVVDLIYGEDEMKNHKLAKESKYYNHPLGSGGSVKRQMYYNKMIGILNDNTNIIEFIEPLKKEFPYVYNAVNVKKISKLNEYFEALCKKYGKENLSEDDFYHNALMFITFSRYLNQPIDEADSAYEFFIWAFSERLRILNMDPNIRVKKGKFEIY